MVCLEANLKSTPFFSRVPSIWFCCWISWALGQLTSTQKRFIPKLSSCANFEAHINNTPPPPPLPHFPPLPSLFPCPLFHFPPLYFQVSSGIRKALLQFHPDRAANASNGDPKLQVEAEESFKILIREKAVLPLILDPVPSPRPPRPKKGTR